MAGETPSRKRRFRRQKPPEAHQGGTGPAEGATASAEHSAALLPHGAGDDERGLTASLEGLEGQKALETADQAGPPTRTPRLAAVRQGVRKSGESAKVGLAYIADRIIENAPRVPVRDLAKLRKQFPGLAPEQLADKLVAGAAIGTSTVGAGIGAAAMLPVPPAMPAELATEIVAVAAIEMKLIAELHEVYGLRPPGNLKERSTAYLASWSEERGINVARPATVDAALGGHLKRELRQQIMKRMVRNLPNLIPFMVGATVGAWMNRRDTKKVADRIRKDLRSRQIPWDALPALPPLEQPKSPLDTTVTRRELET
ncbi:hypothetical protein HRW23_35390 [Streptomyces lunaelactis]|uniref:hypothetical protein n=1 Tax=Streptomyces lunaelactis TaxID=1535768 RepID=UPI00158562D5|nr:hypothetical protein [Streptomyces lunaelactis]NUK00058.1 hypothetical protein [Streptomyces lunaelactis]NUK07020.1 hypothetical protein [Streptomyces lunaelactis]NUK18724.1 hypothetical protein [Streptomyces lunaelactis]NUK21202.1 hypothetical protein [Streptomyces lunaelactis]NUK37537.1 hypothetical protein [Streptomyces lunaelactis]